MEYKRKAMVCDMEKPDDKELWEWLQTLSHGSFSEDTKEYWRKRMLKGKKYESEMEGEK